MNYVLVFLIALGGMGFASQEYYSNKYIPEIESRDTAINILTQKNEELNRAITDAQNEDKKLKLENVNDENKIKELSSKLASMSVPATVVTTTNTDEPTAPEVFHVIDNPVVTTRIDQYGNVTYVNAEAEKEAAMEAQKAKTSKIQAIMEQIDALQKKADALQLQHDNWTKNSGGSRYGSMDIPDEISQASINDILNQISDLKFQLNN